MLVNDYLLSLRTQLATIYDEREASNIANYLVEELFGKLFIKANHVLEPSRIEQLDALKTRLLNNEPLQYVLGEAWFYGKKFKVNGAVLIPRPETEELVDLIINENIITSPTILDIGTGSGCIAIIIKNKIPEASVYSMDISEDAIQLAKENAESNNAQINFYIADIFDLKINTLFPKFDIVVSNPPYVDPEDANTLNKNVIDFEPHLALFGKKGDPFNFYKVIAEFAFTQLKENGKLFFEIPENKGKEITAIVTGAGFKYFAIVKDMQGKERIVYARI